MKTRAKRIQWEWETIRENTERGRETEEREHLPPPWSSQTLRAKGSVRRILGEESHQLPPSHLPKVTETFAHYLQLKSKGYKVVVKMRSTTEAYSTVGEDMEVRAPGEDSAGRRHRVSGSGGSFCASAEGSTSKRSTEGVEPSGHAFSCTDTCGSEYDVWFFGLSLRDTAGWEPGLNACHHHRHRDACGDSW